MSRSKNSKKAMSTGAPPKLGVKSNAKELKSALKDGNKTSEEGHQDGKGINAKSSSSKVSRISRLREEETAKYTVILNNLP
jgi:hypothetical protein